ncbi:MAG: [FeFe] hydrogenase H-cluster maturation GTPase HydF [Bacteroidales bacterium]|nr:[FeFe] hydrogenase H-cluster maturation GTPase HydF [Bacteroidales bacterium]
MKIGRMSKGRENKVHIGIYGRRNVGKSSIINRLAGQDIAIVSDHAGTTTDPVKKSFEITGFGPVVLIDTAGIDDTGELGLKRIEKTIKSIDSIDLAILVTANGEWGVFEDNMVTRLNESGIPYIVIYNKADTGLPDRKFSDRISAVTGKPLHPFTTLDSSGVDYLTELIRKTIPESSMKTPGLLGDIISQGDIILLITPIDVEAPEGRLILPQVQAIRDILDNDAVAVVLKEREVDSFLRRSGVRPALAITDSQIFSRADASVPADIPLTSFSIALARMKGDFESYLKGTPAISELKSGDRVLLLESCSHHVACDDIGRVKIPRWLTSFTGCHLEFDVVAGLDDLPRQVTDYALIIQCGGCMITRRQLYNRLRPAIKAGIPVTNYGMAIAWVQGIYNRAVAPFTGNRGAGDIYL